MSSEFLPSILKADEEDNCPTNCLLDQNINVFGDGSRALSLEYSAVDINEPHLSSPYINRKLQISPLAQYWMLQYLPGPEFRGGFPSSEQNENLQQIYDLTPNQRPILYDEDELDGSYPSPQVNYIYGSRNVNNWNYYNNKNSETPRRSDNSEPSDGVNPIVRMIYFSRTRSVSRRYRNHKILQKLATKIFVFKAIQAMVILNFMVGAYFLPQEIKESYLQDPMLPITSLLGYFLVFFGVRTSLIENKWICWVSYLFQTICLTIACSSLWIATNTLLMYGIVFIMMIMYIFMILESSCLKVDFVHSENLVAVHMLAIIILSIPSLFIIQLLTLFVFEDGQEYMQNLGDLVVCILIPLQTTCFCFIAINLQELILILRGYRIDLPLRLKKINALRCALQLL